MRTPRRVDHLLAVGSGLFKLVGVVALIAAMVALELVLRDRGQKAVNNHR